ncbi:hypothetical protein BKA70DRAFT_1268244 [Coprinopsis sp. MPI-PUGE-AT-0042]|nr:hypothetical protein BKA70DRAFT_1268244 [Coprinopsis sp. MPI-PUGE-AT-0042]
MVACLAANVRRLAAWPCTLSSPCLARQLYLSQGPAYVPSFLTARPFLSAGCHLTGKCSSPAGRYSFTRCQFAFAHHYQ